MKALLESLLNDEDVIIDKFDRKEEINKWIKNNCKLSPSYKIIINPDYTVDIEGSIILKPTVKNIPVDLFRFNRVTYSFVIDNNNYITTLDGCPKICKSFRCSNCDKLKSLKGSPKKCEEFNCWYCDSIESLEEAPEECEDFYCQHCKNLKYLNKAPERYDKFNCIGCPKLELTKLEKIKYQFLPRCNIEF